MAFALKLSTPCTLSARTTRAPCSTVSLRPKAIRTAVSSRSATLVVTAADKKSRCELGSDAVTQLQLHPGDTGSAEVQVALLTSRILSLTQHTKAHHKDYACERTVKKLLAQRTRLLDYLYFDNRERYNNCIKVLGLREKKIVY